jgi:hypothetical protein
MAIKIGDVAQLFRLFRYRCAYFWMAVAKEISCDSPQEIQILFSINIPDLNTFTPY